VVSRENGRGETVLVAYVVLAEGAEVTAGALRLALGSRLPAYMVPSVFVRLDALPLTPNGKVDRPALPAPEAGGVLRDAPGRAPETPVEERLAAAVADLLAVDGIGVDDNFFLLGGSSMLGTQLVVRIGEAFGIELPLRALFAAPTVRLLAAEVERGVAARVAAMSDDEVLRLLATGADG
jgi:acyl carrier protein